MELKKYDLEDRCLNFAKRVRKFIQLTPKSLINIEDFKQLLRSSASVGANYVEANQAISRKDFAHRIKICRKEANESQFWLRLIEVDKNLDSFRLELLDEELQLTKIFAAIRQKLLERV